jgi:hypothetical protein
MEVGLVHKVGKKIRNLTLRCCLPYSSTAGSAHRHASVVTST